MMSLPNTLPTPNTIRPQSVTQLLTSYRPIEAQPLTIPSTLLTLLCPIPSTGNMLFLLLSNGTPNHPLKPISNTPSSVNSFFTIACQVHWLNNHNFFLRALQRQKKKFLSSLSLFLGGKSPILLELPYFPPLLNPHS